MLDNIDFLVETVVVGLASIVDALDDFLNGGHAFFLPVLQIQAQFAQVSHVMQLVFIAE